MTAQLLIYETVVPLSAARHRSCGVEMTRNYGFSSKINSVPLMAVEFPNAASEYAIVFAGNKDNVMPAAILGVRDGENLFLSDDSKWDAKYVPAFVRRYPFVFSTSADEERFILCIDEAFSGFNRGGRGQRLFGDDNKPTQYVQNILTFVQEYQAQFNRTVAFCKKVRELDLLEPMQAQVELATGEKLSLTGFMAVSREKLKALSGEKLAELAKTDELELLYLHIQSMKNFLALPSRLAVVKGGAAAGGSGADAAPATEAGGGLNGTKASASSA
jgi:hypothetical protein